MRPHEALLCYDVGCNGNESDKINAYTIHGLHGRVIPLASGAAVANNKMKVVAMAGDGATFSEGINHLVHGIRNDYSFTFICHNNENYGLTIGQASTTTPKGISMNATPDGVSTESFNSLQFVLSLKPTFVARSFSGDVEHMTEIIQKGLNHKGFSYIEIMQVCPTFNKATPQDWYWDKLKYVTDENHDKTDIWAARKLVDDLEKDLAVGVIYEDKNRVDFENRLISRKAKQTTLVEEVESHSIVDLMQEFV